MRVTFPTASAVVLVSALGVAGSAWAQTVKGTAELGILQPVTKVQGKEVVTTIKVKNLSKGPIAGLKVDEYWYDKQGNPMPGASKQLGQPLAPGAVTTIVLRTPVDPKMDRNTYQFMHANGKVSTKLLAKFE
jgi:energy-converting hydrogenase Eha subunit F